MRILMLGWEFPPFISGGLGTACFGLTKAMSELGEEVQFVLPRPVPTEYSTHVRIMAPRAQAGQSGKDGIESYTVDELPNITFQAIHAQLTPYQSPQEYEERIQEFHKLTRPDWVQIEPGIPADKASLSADSSKATKGFVGAFTGANYEGDMYAEVERYARLAVEVAKQADFDVVHAHDWMTFPAGLAIAAITGKPLVVHVHSTEFDRSGEHVNQRIYDIERQGMHGATRVIAVSFLTKNIATSRYGVSGDKVEVVYNAINSNGRRTSSPTISRIRRDEKIVLFLGRITMQKGPEYFLAAAKKVLEVMENVRFVMAGSGDMIGRTIEMAAQMGIGHKVVFTGFLRGDDVQRIYKMADLYVMPSVSEPFGIAPLEALSHDVPALVSKQSGVAEMLTHVLKCDFWDVNEMANKIIAVLRHPPLHSTLREHGSFEVRKRSWDDAARGVVQVYRNALIDHQG